MGAILNTLPLSQTDNLTNISPNRADWLTAHADATGLAVVEVERLWNRFKQLTGSNEQTKLNPDHNALPNELSNDIFVKNLLKHFPVSKTDQHSIPFGYFLTVMHWFDEASIHDKLGALYIYLNNGEPIDANMISKLLKHVYRETRDDEIKALSHQFMRQLQANERGQLNMEQFIAGVQRCFSPGELEELLKFDIIPAHLLDEANAISSLQSSSTNLRNAYDYGTNDLVSDSQLRQIATQATRRNWTKLAVSLGFLEYDIEAFKAKNNNDSAAALYELLQVWHEQEGAFATKRRLKRSLEQSDFPELIPILN
ncbi:unnamed protein product [Adineta steineri]|uniref:Death domain-containing protein n=2 Tax=Adineta steineri TaxID=433720 RepID=A0A818ZD45_9BILA|nr:unnamed protein product [Adineta steineri]CAF0932767.1 unnamed protein product [Adineta steineri]CAF1381780.1 unnamed protein product [Adineta steineri]CAF3616313.1 unnamed protein product [Adineta steineri]CAF3762047.1 unnamed protein product [Adineta steineri]